jgi:predicted AAA+ superfamily ATPase
MIERALKIKLLEMVKKYPVVTLTGPRQSGKSTLLKSLFTDYQYVSLEDPDSRSFAQSDPRGFLSTYPDKTIIDEVQRVPELFSYIQTHTDSQGKEGMYLLAGSHNFLLMQSVTQSLAGRTAILKLLPFSHSEMRDGMVLPGSVNEEIFKGAYPRIYDKNILPEDFYPYYLQTYVERDVRLLKNIGDLSNFIRFIKLCAGRIGQLLNLSSLANDCGISVSTASEWISLLEASYIVHLLKPDHVNYSKRLVKSPKLYFYDTGLACSLLEIKTLDQLNVHYLRGSLFENLVINEFIKSLLHRGEEPQISFWRDKIGNELDLIYRMGNREFAFEIKSGQTFSADYFKGINYWKKYSKADPENCFVVYAGEKSLKTSNGRVFAWEELIIPPISQ